VRGDPALAAKALDAFARQEQVPTIRGGLIGTELLTGDAVRRLARLPSRDQLNAQVTAMVASPLTGLVRGLGSLLSGLAIALGQLQVKRAGEAPAQSEAAPEKGPHEEPAASTDEAQAEPAAEAPAGEQPEPEQNGAEAPEAEATSDGPQNDESVEQKEDD
jgi:large subunit ribosomal protein L10